MKVLFSIVNPFNLPVLTNFNFSSASYPEPEGGEKMDVDEEVDGPATLEGDDFNMVLPSGVTVGHRSLIRYIIKLSLLKILLLCSFYHWPLCRVVIIII